MVISKAEYVQLAQFRSALRAFLYFSESRARQAGLTPQQHQLLLAIKGRPARDWASVGELAAALQVAHNAAVSLVTRAESAGLLARAEDPNDRRQVRVTLTERGERILAQLSADHKRELERMAPVLTSLLELFQKA